MMSELAQHTEKFRYFYEIANEGTLQSTSRKLGISTPSLSYAIKQLEIVTGCTLFNRSKTGVTLTSSGEKLFIFCRRYYREMEETQQLMAQPGIVAKQRIRIGTFASKAIYFWPQLIELLKSHSNLSTSILTNRSQSILESLLNREIDLALTVGTIEQAKLISHQLYTDEYAFYIRASAKQVVLTQADLKNYVVLYIPDAKDEDKKSLRHYLRSLGLFFGDEFELDSFEVIGEFIKRNYGIGILPTKVAKTYGSSICPLKIKGMRTQKFGTHRFNLLYRTDLDLPQSVINLVHNAAKKAVAASFSDL